MFKNKLASAINKVNSFITELQEGIEVNAGKVSVLDTDIAQTKTKAFEKVMKINAEKDAKLTIQRAEQVALFNDIKTAEALVANLTQLKKA